jgi:predicted nucleic acid-binding protein
MTAFDINVLIYACDKSNTDRQKRASRKLAPQGFTPQHAWSRLAEFRAVFPLIVPTEPALTKAQALHLRAGWSFWDAMITAACEVANVKCEDMSGRPPSGSLEIVNPFAIG